MQQGPGFLDRRERESESVECERERSSFRTDYKIDCLLFAYFVRAKAGWLSW